MNDMPKRNAYTMRDVARLAGVSISTVSSVVNNKGIVSRALTEKVQQAIEALGFVPHRGARGLRVGRTRVIGMVVQDATNPFFVEVMRGVEDAAIENSYDVMVCNSNDQPNLERRHLNALHAQRVDGILVAPTDSYVAREILMLSAAPTVFVDCVPFQSKVDCVVTDNFEASYEAVRYLIGLRHQRIGVIAGRLFHSTSFDRMEGCRKAMREAGLPIREENMLQGDSHVESGYRCGLSLLKSSEPPTAIFSLNNRMTLGILRALRELAIHCPGCLSLMSFDDSDWATVFSPTLTVIEQPTYQIGRTAVQLLLESIQAGENADVEKRQVVLKSCLRIRESTGPAPTT
jgi:LacI family transcriptional regulator